ncbi:MAG TPA: hypothetical protein VNI81_13465 [Candidatus Limnocylindrales bacterium]|nr:hypothetical protein [Candidatus Limnocylindrales bacterium]
MSPRSAFMQLITKAAIGFGALFLVGVVLAAIPSHRAPVMAGTSVGSYEIARQEQQQGQAMEHSKMPGMAMETDDSNSAEAGAMHDMAHMHHGENPHMHLTSRRPQTAADEQRANEIVKELRAGIEKYRDYHVALNEGYKIFLPNVPQPEYHFTNYAHGFLEAFTFDPARPTSLLYKKTADGYELVGAMYTMPKRASEEQLNDRVPLSVATWHLHTNLCMPPRDQRKTADYTKFGLHGSITTEDACDAAGGKFRLVVFGWMVHVYPDEDSPEKIFAMHHRD